MKVEDGKGEALLSGSYLQSLGTLQQREVGYND